MRRILLAFLILFTGTSFSQFSSVNITQASTVTVPTGSTDNVLLRVEIVCSGPASLSSVRVRLDGTMDPLDFGTVRVYSTGNVNTFATTNLFGSTTVPANATNYNVNGTQALINGSNYIWIATDVAGGATIGNTVDIKCNRVVVDATDHVIGAPANDPAGDREIVAGGPVGFGVYPGDLGANMQAWFEASMGTAAATVASWPNQGINASLNTLTAANAAPRVDGHPAVNFNTYIQTTNNYAGTFHKELNNRFQIITGSEVTMYVVKVNGQSTDLTLNFHGSTQTNPTSNGANQWLSWGFRHTGIGTTFSNGTGNSLLYTTEITNASRNASFIGMYAEENSGATSSINGNYRSRGNTGTWSSGNNFMEYSLGYWPGYGSGVMFCEALTLDSKVSIAERNRLETYLAIKYGITLGINGTSANYVSPVSGATIWGSGPNAGYAYDIAGVARFDDSHLNQIKSHSTNGNTFNNYNDIVTVAVGTDFANPAAIGGDNSSLIWGHNNGALHNTGSLVNYPTDNFEVIEAIFTRRWKSQESGTLSTVTLEFDMSNVPGVMNVPGANDLANLRLLVDEDGDYSFGATSIAPSSFNNATGMVYFEHDFVAGNILPLTQNRGFFFTLGTTDHTTTPLPVEMEEFTVKSNNCSLNLNWVTNTESQIDYYLLEYSTDGSNWNELKTVEPKGSENFSNAYSESIQHTTIGLQYIRISEIDTDGNQRLLDTKSIVHKCTTEDCINLYPNPTIGTVNVTGCNWESIEFFDNNMRMVKSERYNGQTVLDVSNLVSGTYMIRVMLDDNRIEFKKLIIQ